MVVQGPNGLCLRRDTHSFLSLFLCPSANFKRPVVILGPVADIAMQKLTAEMPDEFEIAGEKPDPLAILLVNRFPTLVRPLGSRQLEGAAYDVLWGES